MSDTVLYDYWRSSASYRVRIALNILGDAYRSVPVDLLTGSTGNRSISPAIRKGWCLRLTSMASC